MSYLHEHYERMRFGLERERCREFFEEQIASPPKAIGATRAALSQMLRSIDLVGWSRNEESGRLDRKAFTRLAAGATTVFSRRDMKAADRSAVTILVDCSGSMAGEVMAITAQVSIQLAKMLEQAKVNTAVIGFTGSEPNDNHDDDTGRDEQVLVTVPFKNRGESLRAAAEKMGAIRDCASSGNPDYAALMFAIEEIATQPEQRKVIFFLTDTGSYDKSHMKQAQLFADRLNVTLIAIGIGARVEGLFKHGADVYNLSALGGRTFTALLRTLRAKD